MSHKRIPKRKAAVAVGGVAALGAAAFLLPMANASQDNASGATTAAPKTLKATDASDLASQLQDLLGQAFAGSYYDSGKQQLVVNVISAGSAIQRVFNPYLPVDAFGQGGTSEIQGMIYESLAEVSQIKAGDVKPWLATSWRRRRCCWGPGPWWLSCAPRAS